MRNCAILFVLLSVCFVVMAQSDQAVVSGVSDIKALNRAFEQATRRMDNAAIIALWADDGIVLLPSTKPMVGKAAIAKFMDDVTAPFKGASMDKFEMECFDIVVSGDLASEWCTEHQVVRLPGGKPPFDGRGKMLLVLHKSTAGHWQLQREMWNQAASEN